ncbi:MAG: ACP S-malonyltransferase [Acidobacteriota bacterium]
MAQEVFLFPGQGSQTVGMGKDLYENSEFGKKTFDLADEILGFNFKKICFEGPEDDLKLTQNTQPALLTVSYILYNLMEKEPVISAGHSLGEYSAVLCAGGLKFEDALLLVHKRGKYMQEAVPVGKGAMAALIGADINLIREKTEATGGKAGMANWNSRSQIVISGEKESVEKVIEEVAAPKSVMLPVSAPFHSSLMLPAEEKLSVDLDNVEFNDLNYPIINNVDVEEITDKDKVRDGLKRQVSRPVLWHTTVLKLLEDLEMDKFTEVGTGKVLAGLIKRTAREIEKNIEVSNIQFLTDISGS